MPHSDLTLPTPSCLLVVDPQAQFCNDHTRHIYPRIENLLRRYQYVVVSRLVPEPGGPIDRLKRWRPAAPGTQGHGLCIDLAGRDPEATFVTDKSFFPAFTASVRAWVGARGVREVHVCGGDTDLCVLQTAAAIMEAGLRPVILAGACASYAGDTLHRHALIQMKRLLGKEQVVFPKR